MIDLKKIITEGSLRGIGQNHNNLPPQKTVIGGNSISQISNAMGLPSYKIGRIKTTNAFVVSDREKIFYVYVNPIYKNYRKLFLKFIDQIPDNYHVDHILARNLANHYKYNYVLICMLPNTVNSLHGRVEKIKKSLDLTAEIPAICYMDERVFHKVLSRHPTARQIWDEIKEGYSPESVPKYGLTLKQKGIWNSAFGFYKSKLKNLSLTEITCE